MEALLNSSWSLGGTEGGRFFSKAQQAACFTPHGPEANIASHTLIVAPGYSKQKPSLLSTKTRASGAESGGRRQGFCPGATDGYLC